MCGLAGVWRHDGGPVTREEIAAMVAPIVHRGPDDSGEWLSGRVGFGHRRLSIIDLSAASRQPMITADGLGVLIYNGELYNYRELRAEMEREGARFTTTGDAEVVLQALHRWGPESSLPRFNGMFAVAYFDGREKALWLARDRIGIKPLLVADTGRELLFASEAKAILAHPRFERRINERVLDRFLLGRSWDSTTSFFAGIEGVAPGSWWRVSEAGVERRTYFDVLGAVDVERLVANGRADPGSFVEPFAAALRASTKLHLASDAPLGTMCSGGVDSSLITAYAKETLPDVRAFVADIPWPGGEAAQAERVGKHLGVPVERVRVDRTRLLGLWPRTVWHSDGPTSHPSDAALLAVTETCRDSGIKVLLTGEGSDELFAGYDWYAGTLRAWRRLEWPRRLFTRRRRRLGRDLRAAPFSNMPAARDHRLRRRLILFLDGERELYAHRLLERLGPVEPASDRAFLAHALFDVSDYISWILHRHDRIGMAASMEMRVPFLENAMFDFAFHLPRRAKFRRRTSKWVVKEAAAKVLPREVVYARKKGFPVPEAFTLGSEAILAGGMVADRFGWTAEATRRVMAMAREDAHLRFQLAGAELWMRLFFDGASADALGERLLASAA
ncbi:MAG: asparagine synthase (glutamine-hydrolyzing) [Bauldia sp.]|nr:asparagine synthase (glutamine-hydrolyzing) [Bauldia sp.]